MLELGVSIYVKLAIVYILHYHYRVFVCHYIAKMLLYH